MNRKIYVILVIISFLLAGCSGNEPVLPTKTATLVPPTATNTSIPPTNTSVPPTSTPLPTEVIVLVNPETMKVVSSWNSTINAFTLANNPAIDFSGLTASDVGFWNNSRLGFDLYNSVTSLLSAALGSPWQDGLYGCPKVDEAFSSCSLRLYFTDDSIIKISGGARVIFQSNPQ